MLRYTGHAFKQAPHLIQDKAILCRSFFRTSVRLLLSKIFHNKQDEQECSKESTDCDEPDCMHFLGRYTSCYFGCIGKSTWAKPLISNERQMELLRFSCVALQDADVNDREALIERTCKYGKGFNVTTNEVEEILDYKLIYFLFKPVDFESIQ